MTLIRGPPVSAFFANTKQSTLLKYERAVRLSPLLSRQLSSQRPPPHSTCNPWRSTIAVDFEVGSSRGGALMILRNVK